MLTKTCKNCSHRQLPSHTEVGQLGVAFCVQQNVPGLYVSVDLPHEVQVLQSLQGGFEDGGDLVLCELGGDKLNRLQKPSC